MFTSHLAECKQSLRDEIKHDADDMKTYVLQQMKRNSAHRENVAKSYDEKLTHIKDVCASFFSKNEQLQSDASLKLKQMSDQQQEWIDLIVKP